VPIFKPRLTRREQAKYFAVAEELLAGGIVLEIPDEWRDNARALHIEIGGPPASSIYQLASGIVVYVVRAKLVAERGGIILEDFEITPAWDRDVYPCGSEGGSYRLAAGLQYDWNEVLNHRIENRLRFRRGDLADGWLLATGSKPIPPQYGPGRPAPLEVAFLDQFSEQHKVSGDFVVERSAKTLKSPVRPRPGPFDPVDSTASMERNTGKSSQLPAGPQLLRELRECAKGSRK
jgi:hypothetical protein